MKNNITLSYLILTTLFLLFSANAPGEEKDVVVIKKMNTPSIVIGNVVKKVGSTFALNENIDWQSDNQAMYVQIVRTKEYLILKKEAFESKSVRSLENYILTCKASTRSVASHKIAGKNKELYNGEKRIALVIGNSNYLYADFIKNPVFDASAVTEQLVECGFDTFPYYDCSASEMESVISRFINQASSYDVALFYFAGHGLSWNQRYYYIPIDADLDSPSQLNSCVEGYSLINRLQQDDRTTLVLLDACRTKHRGWARGMDDDIKVQMEAPLNMVVVNSTTDGSMALDGDYDLSPFAEGFIESIQKPGLSFSDCTIIINKYLYEKTGHLQNATESNSLMEPFYFQPIGHNRQKSSAVRSSTKMTISQGQGMENARDRTPNSNYSNSNMDEQYEYGMHFYEKKGTKDDYEKAFVYLKPLADYGYTKAYFPVADMYHRGLGVKKDRNEAEKWYQKAADAGDAKAKRILLNSF